MKQTPLARSKPMARGKPMSRGKPKARPARQRAKVVASSMQPVRAAMATAILPAAAQPKPQTVRSRSWLAAVRTLKHCVLCEADGVEAAHRNEDKGMGIKAHDCCTAALCRDCHREIDQGKDLSRGQRRAEIDRAIVLTLVALVQAGKVGVL